MHEYIRVVEDSHCKWWRNKERERERPTMKQSVSQSVNGDDNELNRGTRWNAPDECMILWTRSAGREQTWSHRAFRHNCIPKKERIWRERERETTVDGGGGGGSIGHYSQQTFESLVLSPWSQQWQCLPPPPASTSAAARQVSFSVPSIGLTLTHLYILHTSPCLCREISSFSMFSLSLILARGHTIDIVDNRVYTCIYVAHIAPFSLSPLPYLFYKLILPLSLMVHHHHQKKERSRWLDG